MFGGGLLITAGGSPEPPGSLSDFFHMTTAAELPDRRGRATLQGQKLAESMFTIPPAPHGIFSPSATVYLFFLT